jgi:hypothetical protein
LRSCAVVFILRGEYARAANYLELDRGSEFERPLSIHALVRQGQERAASTLAPPKMPQWRSYGLLLACAAGRPPADVAVLAESIAPSDDAETNFFAAAHLAYCGRTSEARALLQRAIAAGYCSYPTIESDPLFVRIREQPEFSSIRSAARQCREHFLRARGRP